MTSETNPARDVIASKQRPQSIAAAEGESGSTGCGIQPA
jgi:hypothetical protein